MVPSWLVACAPIGKFSFNVQFSLIFHFTFSCLILKTSVLIIYKVHFTVHIEKNYRPSYK